MRLPKKITPDRIRESIVQVFFTSDIPLEPLVGYLYGSLGDIGYKYTNRPLRKQSSGQGITNEININELLVIPQYFFFNEEIKIHLQRNTLVFNCVNEYIGWQNYSTAIQKALTQLKNNKVIKSYTRIGIRYISEFPNIDILEKIKFGFNMDVMQSKMLNGNFRIEWEEKPYKIAANIGSKLPITSLIEESVKVEYVSLIDLDIIIKDFETDNNEDFFKTIEEAHTKQKTLFFSLLDEKFLETLNPEYD